MAKTAEKSLAIELRKRGESIKEIASTVGVSKSTVSIWCRDIELSEQQKEKLKNNMVRAGHKGRMIGAEMNRRKKQEAIERSLREAKKGIGRMTKRDLLIAGSALYWAEGSKTESRCVFINSDPSMIILMHKFFVEVMGVRQEDIEIVVQINKVHSPRIEKVLQFWQNLLQLPRQQFGKVYYVKATPKKKYDNHDSYYGTVRLVVRRGTSVQYKILGYIKALSRGSSIG